MSFLNTLKEGLGIAPVIDEDEVEEVIKAEEDNPNGTPTASESSSTPQQQNAESTESAESAESTESTESTEATSQPAQELTVPAEEVSQDSPVIEDENSSEFSDETSTTSRARDDLIQKIIDDAIASTDQDNAVKAEKTTDTEVQPKEARNAMRDIKFYNKISEKIYDYDRGIGMSADLREWLSGAIEGDKELSADFVRKVLPKVLEKNPELADFVKEVLRTTADSKIVPYKLFFVNVKDTDDKNEYESMKAACDSIRKEIDTYGINPKDVFKAVYRKADAEGKLGDRVSLDEVEKYVDAFDGDKNALRKKLHLPRQSATGNKPDKAENKNSNKSNKPKKQNKSTDSSGSSGNASETTT